MLLGLVPRVRVAPFLAGDFSGVVVHESLEMTGAVFDEQRAGNALRQTLRPLTDRRNAAGDFPVGGNSRIGKAMDTGNRFRLRRRQIRLRQKFEGRPEIGIGSQRIVALLRGRLVGVAPEQDTAA